MAGDDLIAVLDAGSRSLFGYVDGVLSAIATQMEHERDELIGGALARRREMVTLILDGAPIPEARASARLGYELARVHTAAIAWSDGTAHDQGALESAVGALAQALGASRPFLVPAGASAVWAWISGVAPDSDQLRAAAGHVPAGIRMTLGASLPGIAGFRDSHSEARAAQRLLMRAPGGPRFTTYADVQVVSLASQDAERAAAFVAAALGELRHADAELLETVRVYLQQDSNAARAAALLFTHRNTVLKRIGRADGLLPRPLAGNGFEVRLALELMLARRLMRSGCSTDSSRSVRSASRSRRSTADWGSRRSTTTRRSRSRRRGTPRLAPCSARTSRSASPNRYGCSVPRKTIVLEQPERRTEVRELADLFCGQARRRADTLFATLFDNDDAASYAVAQGLIGGRNDWLASDVLDPSGDGPMMPSSPGLSRSSTAPQCAQAEHCGVARVAKRASRE